MSISIKDFGFTNPLIIDRNPSRNYLLRISKETEFTMVLMSMRGTNELPSEIVGRALVDGASVPKIFRWYLPNIDDVRKI